MNLLTAYDSLAKKYADTIDKAGFQYIDGMIKLIRERGDNPADYELVMHSQRHIDDPFSTEWVLKIRKIGEIGIVD